MTTPAVLDELRLLVIIDNQADILESTADDLFRRVNPRIVAQATARAGELWPSWREPGFAGYAPSSVGARYRLQEES
jgi:hypothetical protein